jgi:hypothetical protein
MKRNRTYPFWVDIAIPKGTPVGTYTTTIELTSAGAVVGGVAVQLTVWPFMLPDDADVPLISEVNHRKLFSHHIHYRGRPYRPSVDDWRDDPLKNDLDALLWSTLRMLHHHGLTPVLPELAPIVKVTAWDSVTIDWGHYDDIVEPCLNGRGFFSRTPLKAWPMPLRKVLPAADVDGGESSPAHTNLLRKYAAECAAHFAQKDWLARSYAVVPGVTKPSDSAVELTKRFASMVRQGSERIRILSRLFPLDLRTYGWADFPYSDFSESVDIWMPVAQFFDADKMAAQHAEGRSTWVSLDRPPFSGSVSIHASPADVRVLSWQAEELGAKALFIGPINDWPDAEASPSPTDCVGADPDVLLYPGGPFGLDEPVPSARLKHLRRSVQDGAYRRLLREHGLGHLAGTLRSSLAPYAGTEAYRTHFADGRPVGWSADPAAYEDVRHIMAKELLRKPSNGQAAPLSESFARSSEWRGLMMRTRELRAYVDGTRIRLTGTRARPLLEVECALTLMNATRMPVTGELRFVDLPQGWEPRGEQRIGPIPPGGSRRVKLTAYATTVATGPRGFLLVPMELSTDDGMVRRLHARVSYVPALPLAGSIRIDGDLSDWPLGTTNVLSDFALISGPGPKGAATSEVQPRHKTIGFVLRDRENLYIAVNCEADPSLQPATSRRKRVQYEDMIPMAGELVEVLIDPANSGTRSPADLYHIVVMHSGADLAEKGVRFEPPCGRHEPWPVDIDVATGITAGRWLVEMRIPLEAFGSNATDHALWGLNVTRFDEANQEFSTWSGAIHNAYDPLSLGNLLLP